MEKSKYMPEEHNQLIQNGSDSISNQARIPEIIFPSFQFLIAEKGDELTEKY